MRIKECVCVFRNMEKKKKQHSHSHVVDLVYLSDYTTSAH